MKKSICSYWIVLLVVFGLLAGWPGYSPAVVDSEARLDYSRLLDYIAESDLQNPLVLIEDHQGDFDKERNRENIAYLNDNPDLLARIRNKLNGDTVQWKLANSSKRLLAVPEKREEYARLFESYCNEAVAYILDRIHLPNPFAAISTLHGPLPDPAQETKDRTTAYLVHNIAEEYVEEYLFFNPVTDGAKLKIKLSNKVYSGHVGSYSSQLVIGEDSHFEFVRDPYTLWQNSANNPLNVLIVPVEETLHGVLREFTEKAMLDQIKQDRPEKLDDVKAVIDHWMAVEEAIVGGLVAQLMPGLLQHFLLQPLDGMMADTLAERHQHNQYRYLDQGVRMVADLGIEEALALYRAEPQQFGQMVSQDDRASL